MRKTERESPSHMVAQGPVVRCAIEGCRNLAFGTEICDACEEQIDALRLKAAQQHYAAERPAKRLENSAWAAAACTVFLYLLWTLREWFIEWFEIWLHSSN